MTCSAIQTLMLKLKTWTWKNFQTKLKKILLKRLKRLGCDTAKSVLELSEDELIRRTGIDEETIKSVRSVLSAEFED